MSATSNKCLRIACGWLSWRPILVVPLVVGAWGCLVEFEDDRRPSDARLDDDSRLDARVNADRALDTRTDGGGSGNVLDEVDEAFVYAQCQIAPSCGMYVWYGTTIPPEECEQVVRDKWVANWRYLVEGALARGTVTLDEAKAHECALALLSADCADLDSLQIPACDGYLEPRVPEGGNCYFDAECIGGYCETPDEDSCPGRCVRLPGLGEDCSGVWQCEGDLVCVDTAEGDSVCVPRKAVGDSCATQSECQPGLYCDRVTRTCQERKGEGEACSISDECDYGLFCRNGICLGIQVVSAEGAACDALRGIICDYDAGLTCHYDTGRCEPIGSEGDPCRDFLDCDFLKELYCDQPSQTCAAQKDLGETCSDSDECVSVYCDHGVCGYEDCWATVATAGNA